MPFRYLEEIATADVAFEATAPTLEQLFIECARATQDTQVNLAGVRPRIKKRIKLENKKIDQLLFDFLSELIYFKDAEALLFSKFDVKVKKDKIYNLTATVAGEKIDSRRHELRNDVKAVTYHMFVVERRRTGWYARVVLDI